MVLMAVASNWGRHPQRAQKRLKSKSHGRTPERVSVDEQMLDLVLASVSPYEERHRRNAGEQS